RGSLESDDQLTGKDGPCAQTTDEGAHEPVQDPCTSDDQQYAANRAERVHGIVEPESDVVEHTERRRCWNPRTQRLSAQSTILGTSRDTRDLGAKNRASAAIVCCA